MKKGIIVVSFGTSFPEIRKRCIESIETLVKDTFPDHDVRRAFTSNMIIEKLKRRDGLHIDTPAEALGKMIDDGMEEIHVQPLHVIPGFEYEKVTEAVNTYSQREDLAITVGKPLLSEEHHYDELIKALEDRIHEQKDGQGYVLMGHGTEHYANACYSMLQMKLNGDRDDVHIANVEGYPELDDILFRLKDYSKITLLPLMIVAGDHAINDMAGDEEDSFKSILQEEGKSVTCILEGLGESDAVRQIFVKRIVEVIGH